MGIGGKKKEQFYVGGDPKNNVMSIGRKREFTNNKYLHDVDFEMIKKLRYDSLMMKDKRYSFLETSFYSLYK